MSYEIDKVVFDQFMIEYKNSKDVKHPERKWAGLRLGQAFYNKFDLSKLNHHRFETEQIYEADGKEATQLISQMFTIR